MSKIFTLKTALCIVSTAMMFTAFPAMATSPDAIPEGTYTFQGESALTAPNLPTVTCTLKLTGTVSNVKDPNDPLNGEAVSLKITGGDVTGPIFSGCNAITVIGFPWDAYATDASLSSGLPLGPFTFTVQDVTVNYPINQSCTGDVQATFWNGQTTVGDTSYFTFDGNVGDTDCYVETTQPTGLENTSTTDVNVQ